MDGGYTCHIYPGLYLPCTCLGHLDARVLAGKQLKLPPLCQPKGYTGVGKPRVICVNSSLSKCYTLINLTPASEIRMGNKQKGEANRRMPDGYFLTDRWLTDRGSGNENQSSDEEEHDNRIYIYSKA